MKNGWTGGQYSLFRAAFGLYLTFHLLELLPYAAELFSNVGVIPHASDSPLIGVFPNILGWFDAPAFAAAFVGFGALLAVLLALGVRDRLAAVLLWYVWACLFGRNPLISNPGLPYVGWLLLAHAALPGKPYGSWTARGRPDPAGGWQMPAAIFGVAWFLMAAGYSFSGATKLISPSWVDGTAVARVLDSPLARPTLLREGLLALPEIALNVLTWGALLCELLFLPLALIRRLRPVVWFGMLAMHVGLMFVVDFVDLTLGMIAVHAFTFDPAWVPAVSDEEPAHLFYDGNCGLCHRAVRLVLAEETSGERFRFAALDGPTATDLLSEDVRAGLPDSIVVRRADGALLVKSTAVAYILASLGGAWRILGVGLEVLPQVIRDGAYDGIAAIRHRLFASPKDACPLIPPALRTRFDP